MRREIAIWKVLAGVVALLLLSSGGAAALDRGSTEQARPEPRANLTPNRSTTYVPLTPCRIFSTTATGNDFAVGETRAVKAVGNLTSQGGSADCGVPSAATGLEASITATFVEGPGFVRAWPFGQPEPQATFVNYTAAGASTSTGALTIVAGGGNAFNLKNNRSETHLIVDVQGYYLRPMYAIANPNGTLAESSRLTSITKNGTGQYRLVFPADVDSCARQVSVGRSRTSDAASSGFGSAHMVATDTGQVDVLTYDTAGNLTDRAFMLEVTC